MYRLSCPSIETTTYGSVSFPIGEVENVIVKYEHRIVTLNLKIKELELEIATLKEKGNA